MLQTHIPWLEEEKGLRINGEGPCHFLMEGDNLASLQLLLKTHREKIDLIIIDPPYNRGKNDFIYDDDYVDTSDDFRHSKWASFMEIRLRLARRLLKPEGYIFINIDDNELTTLKMVCDEIFREQNFVGMYMWEKTSTAPALSRKVRKSWNIFCVTGKGWIPPISSPREPSMGMMRPFLTAETEKDADVSAGERPFPDQRRDLLSP